MFTFIVIGCEFWCAKSMKGEVFKSSIFLCYSNSPGEILDWLKNFLCKFDKEINLSFSSNSKDWSTDRDCGFTALIFPKNLLEKMEHRDKVCCQSTEEYVKERTSLLRRQFSAANWELNKVKIKILRHGFFAKQTDLVELEAIFLKKWSIWEIC